MRRLALLLPALLLACGDVTVSEQNTPPTASILSPADGASLPEGEPITIEGLVSDRTTAAGEVRVVWSTDVDGAVFDGLPEDRNGNTVLLLEDPASGPLTITLQAFDADGAEASASITVSIENGAPSAPTVTIAPETPTTLDDLVASVETASVDPEGGAVTLVWRWLRDGTWHGAVESGTVPAADTARDETWTVEVRGEDEEGNLSEPGTASVTIENSAPTTPTVNLDPAPATQAQDIACTPSSSDDYDDDAVTFAYDWSLDGTPQGIPTSTLPWSATAIGETWTCIATPSDGTDEGDSGSASTQIIEGCTSYAASPSAPARVSSDAELDLASGDFTVEAWVQWDCLGSTPSVVEKGEAAGGWALRLSSEGAACDARLLYRGDGAGVTGGPTSFGAVGSPQWVHVAAVFVQATGVVSFFLDGEDAGSGNASAPTTTSEPLLIGDGLGGVIDELRISSVARYTAEFVPLPHLLIDPDTVAFWGFEESEGALSHDLSAGAVGPVHDATIQAPSGFSTASSCDVDRPPTDPDVAVTPAFPGADDDLVCDLLVPSVDPEGATITYAGEWLLDGASTANTFSALPATLPAVNTADGEEWTCEVVASDGSQTATDSDTVFVGFEPVCDLVVTTPSADSSTSCSFTPSTAGVLRYTMDNPDASIDGIFTMSAAEVPTTFLFTGPRSWAYLGPQVAGWQSADAEVNVDPSMGTLTLTVAYGFTGGSEFTGTDTLTVDFLPGVTLATGGASLIGTNTSCPTCTVPTTVSGIGIPSGDRLLVEAVGCGAMGGGHGVYADDNGQGGDDGHVKVNTGEASACRGDGLQSHSIDPGTYTFSIVNEDDFFGDNTGTRTLSVYQYAP